MDGTEPTYHIPVLLHESIQGMNLHPGGIYVDVTFGGGGHSKEILRNMGEGSRLFSFDQDADAEKNIINDGRFTFVRSNFRYLHNFLRYYGVPEVDAILADLGVSSHHFDDSERGFSFRFDGKLRHADEQAGGNDGFRHCEHLRGGPPRRPVFPVRRTEKQPQAGCSAGQGKSGEKHCHHQ